jgi:hypothetical protein
MAVERVTINNIPAEEKVKKNITTFIYAIVRKIEAQIGILTSYFEECDSEIEALYQLKTEIEKFSWDKRSKNKIENTEILDFIIIKQPLVDKIQKKIEDKFEGADTGRSVSSTGFLNPSEKINFGRAFVISRLAEISFVENINKNESLKKLWATIHALEAHANKAYEDPASVEAKAAKELVEIMRAKTLSFVEGSDKEGSADASLASTFNKEVKKNEFILNVPQGIDIFLHKLNVFADNIVRAISANLSTFGLLSKKPMLPPPTKTFKLAQKCCKLAEELERSTPGRIHGFSLKRSQK